MAQTSPSREADKIVVRVPDGMRPALAARAKRNLRSTNAEVVMILANALGDESKPATGASCQARPVAGPYDPACQGGPATHG